jgi:hypothetical protein
VLINPGDKDVLATVYQKDMSMLRIINKTEDATFDFHIDGFFVSCYCWGPSGNTLWIGDDFYVSIVEIDRSGNWLRNIYVGAGSTAIASDETSVVTCIESKEDTWPKLVVIDYATGSIVAAFGAFGLDNGLLCPKTTNVAIVGSHYIVAAATNPYLVRVDKEGNMDRINLEGGTVVAMCNAHNGRDVYVCTARMPQEVQRVDIFTGVVQNAWAIPAGAVTDITCIATDKHVVVFSAETQLLYTYV